MNSKLILKREEKDVDEDEIKKKKKSLTQPFNGLSSPNLLAHIFGVVLLFVFLFRYYFFFSYVIQGTIVSDSKSVVFELNDKLHSFIHLNEIIKLNKICVSVWAERV